MSPRRGDYGFPFSWLEALHIYEAWDRISLLLSEGADRISLYITEEWDSVPFEVSEAWERISGAIETLRAGSGGEQKLGRLVNTGFVGLGLLGLVGGVLLLANLFDAASKLPPMNLKLPSINFELPQINFELPQINLDFLRFPGADTSSASLTPVATPSPTEPAYYVVANTGGQGVYIRASTVMTDRIKAFPDSTYMAQVGPDRESDGRTWKNVKAPDGTVGWIPAPYLSAAPAPSATPGPNATPRRPTATPTVAPTATPRQ